MGKGTIWWWEDVMAQGKDKGPRADKGNGKSWGVPLGSRTSHKGCDMGHQGKYADKGKPVEGKGWGVLPGHADKGKPVEGKAGVYILPFDPLTRAARASMQTRASSWRVRARAASRNTSLKPRGGHSGSQNQATQYLG